MYTVTKASPHRVNGRGHDPRGRSLSAAEPTVRQRGPYRGRAARLSFEDRLAARAVPRPECKCGCGTLTRWLTGKGRWAVYAVGHHRQAGVHRDHDWLVEQYIIQRHTIAEIAAMCDVSTQAIKVQMQKFGIPRRSRSESRMGRMVGPKNAAWKGGVAQWDYSPDWKALARRIRDRDEWTCQSCGEQRVRWGHSLHVHHLDENKLNNDPANLISLCATCHRKAHRREVI